MNPFEEAGYIYPPHADKECRITENNPALLPDGTPVTIISIDNGIAHVAVTRITEGKAGESEILMASERVEKLRPFPAMPPMLVEEEKGGME